VWEKPTNTFRLRNLTIAKQVKAFARATKENTLHFHSQRNALTMFLAFLFIMAVACFNKLSLSTQTAWLFATEELLYRKILWALPKPAIFEKIE
jgi:hypothetical protein